MMKKKDKKEIRIAEHRGNVREVLKNYQLEMKIVRKIPKSYYSSEGGVK